jgi:predicted house-cleaning NTP pyrophosphatase (Maf/HAM1 superfamily)
MSTREKDRIGREVSLFRSALNSSSQLSQADCQGLGGVLIEKIEGNYDNCVGFPSAPFWRWLSELAEEGTFDEAW